MTKNEAIEIIDQIREASDEKLANMIDTMIDVMQDEPVVKKSTDALISLRAIAEATQRLRAKSISKQQTRLLKESIEVIRWFEKGLWPTIEKGRKKITVRPQAPSNTSISWDMAIYHVVKFVEGQITKNE